jgi:hypothetical protein
MRPTPLNPAVRYAPLLPVLAGQVIISIMLIRSNTAFLDEAVYLFAGHQEISHLLTGAPITQYETYFSGAPWAYPVLAATIDSAGGLAAARAFSLLCVIGATVCLYAVTDKLFGRLAAFFATTLFALLGPTQFLSALSTFDAMVLLLIALSVLFVVLAVDSRHDTMWLVWAGISLGLSDVVKYAAGIFTPVVILLVYLVFVPRVGRKSAALAAAGVTSVAAMVCAVAFGLADRGLLGGVLSTTVARPHGTDPESLIVSRTWSWIGLAMVGALIGLVVSLIDRTARDRRLLCLLLVAAGLLAPLNQARIHTVVSLLKHCDFGAWFACICAGYGAAWLVTVGRRRIWAASRAVAVAGFALAVGVLGLGQASYAFGTWPNAEALVNALRPLTIDQSEPYLVEQASVVEYYLRDRVDAEDWADTFYFSYPDARTGQDLTGIPAYEAAIHDHFFAVVALDLGATPDVDHAIQTALDHTPGYRLTQSISGDDATGNYSYLIWRYIPDS